MKKSTFLKLTFSFALAVLAVGAFSQADYKDLEDATTPAGGITEYVTVDKTLPYVVAPDPFYNSDWATWSYTKGAVDPGVTLKNTWSWSLTAPHTFVGAVPAATDVAEIDAHTDDKGPIANITWNTIGSYELNVHEVNEVAGLNCDGAEKTIQVEVVAAPTIELSTAAPEKVCTSDLAVGGYDIVFTIKENVAITATDPGGEFYFSYAYAIRNVDGDGDQIGNAGDPVLAEEGDVVYNDVSGAFGLGDTGFATDGAGNHTLTIHMDPTDLATEGNMPTEYTWTLKNNATDALGISSRISRKSDYITATGYYEIGTSNLGAANLSASITVFPTPTTGPIYHVPNM